MPNANYRKGANKERKIVNEFRAKDCVAFRSAGSHSPIDVCVIDSKNKIIKLIQAKMGYVSPKERGEILDQGKELDGTYDVKFQLWE